MTVVGDIWIVSWKHKDGAKIEIQVIAGNIDTAIALAQIPYDAIWCEAKLAYK